MLISPGGTLEPVRAPGSVDLLGSGSADLAAPHDGARRGAGARGIGGRRFPGKGGEVGPCHGSV